MSVSVHMMSGDVISVDIFEGFRVRNLRNEVYVSMREKRECKEDIDNSDRLLFSKMGDDEEVDDYDFVNDGDIFRVFVKPIEDIPAYRLRLYLNHNGIICLRNNEGFLIQYYGWEVEDRLDEFLDTERVVVMPKGKIILEVDITEDGYDVMRRDIVSSLDHNRESDRGDLNYGDLDSNERTFDIFFDRFMRLDSFDNVEIVDIVYFNDENEEYDPEVDVDGDQEWD